jgi:hypothetical protein
VLYFPWFGLPFPKPEEVSEDEETDHKTGNLLYFCISDWSDLSTCLGV